MDFGGRRRIVFVVGSGRSGTHWLGHILSSHPQIRITIEDPRVFPQVTAMALDPATIPHHLPQTVSFYRRQMLRSWPRHYADKSHPNLWLAELLADEFGEAARFVGIERNPFAVAASSLRHEGVIAWNSRWRDYPVPNRFLGITEELAPGYDELTATEKFAHRWLSHHKEMQRLQTVLGQQMHVLQYEDLADQLDEQAGAIWDFLEVRRTAVKHATRAESRDLWREHLNEKQIRGISVITQESVY